MPTNFESYTRLEPRPYERNLDAGIAARVHDPLWFIARQWQMGELQGENASSPVWASYGMASRPIRFADSRFDPAIVPAEAIVESEQEDWWTMGRRIRMGKRVSAQIPDPTQLPPSVRFTNPPPPYELFLNEFDGRELWRLHGSHGITAAMFGDALPDEVAPAWDSTQLVYRQGEDNAFSTDQATLTVPRHRGGRMDWHSVDAASVGPANELEAVSHEVIPTALQYPGAPNSRWWEVEHGDIDPGSYVPDTAHSSTAMLTDLVFSHSDDWYLFPVTARAGNVVSIESLGVTDSFGRTYRSTDVTDNDEWKWPGPHAPEDWTLFRVEGLRAHDLVLWHVAELPLESKALERVQFGYDEESNLVWAVEKILDGREVDPTVQDSGATAFNEGKPSGDTTKDREFAYVPARGIVLHWHPYRFKEDSDRRMLVKHRLADLSWQRPSLMPGSLALVLMPETHEIEPRAIPHNGIEVERRWQLARAMDGAPVLWVERQRHSLLSPPARRLRFDVMETARQP